MDFSIEIHPENGIRVRLQNPKSGFQSLNPDFRNEGNLSLTLKQRLKKTRKWPKVIHGLKNVIWIIIFYSSPSWTG